ncbi:MAG TPA: hypothetical protein VGJ82_14530 [Thermoanaerobaculia bacterium]
MLSYAISTNPDPLQASPLDGVVSYGAITIVVSNGRQEPVYCDEIRFSFPEGTLAQDLTNEDAGILAVISPSSWDIAVLGGGLYSATPSKPSANEITTSGLVAQIYNIAINDEPGSVPLSVVETSSTTNSKPFSDSYGQYTLPKFPYGFFFGNFAPSSPQVSNNGSVTLTWEAADGATYTLYWGAQSVDVTEVRTYTAGPLNSDTTFLLQASYQLQGETAVISLTATVNVSTPDLTVNTLNVNNTATIGTLSVHGPADLGADGHGVNIGSPKATGGVLTVLSSNSHTEIGDTYVTVGQINALWGTLQVIGSLEVHGSVQMQSAFIAMQPPQELWATKLIDGNHFEQDYVASTDGFVIGSVSPNDNVTRNEVEVGFLGAWTKQGVSVSATGGMFRVDDQNVVPINSSLTLPVARKEVFTISQNYTVWNNAHLPSMRWWFIPLGNGTCEIVTTNIENTAAVPPDAVTPDTKYPGR